METFKTKFGGQACSFDGYLYRFRDVSGIQKRWRCFDRSCQGKLWSSIQDDDPVPNGEHNHMPDPDLAKVKKVVSEMKERAKEEVVSIPSIHLEAAASLANDEAAAAIFPTFKSVASSLYGSRRKEMPPLPRGREEIDIPIGLRTSITGEDMLLFADEGNRYMVFGTHSNFERLCNARHIFVDGTFSVTPPFFQQVFTIHAFIMDKQFPLLWCLLPEKSRNMYKSLFRMLKDKAIQDDMDFSPTLVTSDFESGLIPAVREEFPQARHIGCFFHFTQAVFRHVKSLGFESLYKDNELIRLKCRMLMSLAFLPLPVVRATFDDLFDDSPLVLRPLFDYFAQTWINGQVELHMWNMYGILRRTNNDLEAWHKRFSAIVRKYHPNIYEFTKAMVTENDSEETTILTALAGTNVTRPNAKYVRINNRLIRLQAKYDGGEIGAIQYIRGVSYNLADPIAF